MAEPTIKIKRSSVAGKIPTTANLALGELAVNTYDGKVFLKQDQGGVGVGTTVVAVNPWNVGLGTNAYNINFTAGSVGIGTTNLSAGIKLEILGGEIKAGRVDSSSEGGQLSFGRAIDNATGWYIDVYGNTSTPYLRFVDVSTASVRVAIDSSGNFGIKNATPTSALDVSGDAKISGVVTATTFYGNFNGSITNATYATTAGIATYATSSGISTYATTAGIATYATTAGIATYATTAGIATYATTAGISTYATTAGIATYATTAGVSTSVSGGTASVTQLNVSGVTTTTTLDISSQILSGYATSTTTATTANQVIFSGLSTSTYRSAEFIIQATEGTNYQVEKVLVIHNGTTTYNSEYGNITSGNLVGNFDTDISGGNLRLLVTPASANSTTFKVSYTAIRV